MSAPAPEPRSGLPHAIAAYAIWGVMPVYLKLMAGVSAFEILAHRIIWSLPVALLFLLSLGQWNEYRAALGNRRALCSMLASSALISINWGVYMWAVMNDHVLATSLGYYLNPLVNVLLGRLVLRETLNRVQGLAVGIAAIAVSILIIGEPGSIWISLSLAFSFGLYGLVRKMAPVGPVAGLTLEVTLLFPIAACALLGGLGTPQGFGSSTGMTLLMIGSGFVTAIPLLLFATAARRMDYTALAFVQYFSPTIVFFLGIFAYHEPVDARKLACFALIWLAIAIFTADAVRRYRRG